MTTNEPTDDVAEADSDFLRTDPVQRRKVQRLIFAMGIVALLFLWLGLPALKHWVDVADIPTVIHRMSLLCVGLGALLFATACYCCLYARRIFRSGQFPPPGTWVLRDTRLLRGDHAYARAWWVIACAISFLMLAGYATVLPSRIEGLLRAASRMQPGSLQSPQQQHLAPHG